MYLKVNEKKTKSFTYISLEEPKYIRITICGHFIHLLVFTPMYKPMRERWKLPMPFKKKKLHKTHES